MIVGTTDDQSDYSGRYLISNIVFIASFVYGRKYVTLVGVCLFIDSGFLCFRVFFFQ